MTRPELKSRYTPDGKLMSPTTEDQEDFHIYHLVGLAEKGEDKLNRIVNKLREAGIIK